MVSESAVTDADYSGRDCFHHKSDESRQGRRFLPNDQPTNPTTRPLAHPHAILSDQGQAITSHSFWEKDFK